MTLVKPPKRLSITDASSRGITALARDVEAGTTFLLEHHSVPVAAIIGARRLYEYEEAERDLRDLSLVVTRVVSDGGRRSSLDEVITHFGFDRDILTREVDEDLVEGSD